MIEAVAGFLFSEDHERVALIRKKRPAFHAGMLNGIGGHVEANESFAEAMTREFREETGVHVTTWKPFLNLQVAGWAVHFFRAASDIVYKVKTNTDEDVGLYWTNNIRVLHVVPNLRWIIPMALNSNVIRADVVEASS